MDGKDGIDGKDGEPGEPGENGTNCTVADTTDTDKDRTGYKLLCADTLKGIVWNGEDGKDGASALELSGYDDMDELLDALKGDPGKNGTSCTVADTTDEADNTKTGYKLLCDGTLKGVVWNGEKGQKGDPADLTLEYYNKLLLGQKGSGISWKASEGCTKYINEVFNYWMYYNDGEDGRTTGKSNIKVGNKILATQGLLADEDVDCTEGVGGEITVGPLWKHSTNEWWAGFAQIQFEQATGGSVNWPTNTMLGLCVEYQSDFDTVEVRIEYDSDGANDWGRPLYKLTKSTKKKVVNLPWAIFDAFTDFGVAKVDVSEAIKNMRGVQFTIQNVTYDQVTGDFYITKLGAYGTCE